MNKDYLTVEQISKLLNIHPKTIQRYIREGKLRAIKVGKSWRVSGHDLSVFLEGDDVINSDSKEERRITVSSVIDISTNGAEDVTRILNLLTAAHVSKPSAFSKTAMRSQCIECENIVRVTVWGDIRFMSAVVDMITAISE